MDFASQPRGSAESQARDSNSGSRTGTLGGEIAGPSHPTPESPADMPRWMRRVSIVVYVLFCLEVGMLLVLLPWTRVWTENSLLAGYPQVQVFLSQGFVRGLVSGLGLVDIWLGVWEALRYRKAGFP